jgi:hypothetical protein
LDRLRAPDSVPLAPEASGDAAELLARAASLGFLREAASLPLASDCSAEPGRLTPPVFLRPDGVFSPRVVCPERPSLLTLSLSLRSASESSSEFFLSLCCEVSWLGCDGISYIRVWVVIVGFLVIVVLLVPQ